MWCLFPFLLTHGHSCPCHYYSCVTIQKIIIECVPNREGETANHHIRMSNSIWPHNFKIGCVWATPFYPCITHHLKQSQFPIVSTVSIYEKQQTTSQIACLSKSGSHMRIFMNNNWPLWFASYRPLSFPFNAYHKIRLPLIISLFIVWTRNLPAKQINMQKIIIIKYPMVITLHAQTIINHLTCVQSR